MPPREEIREVLKLCFRFFFGNHRRTELGNHPGPGPGGARHLGESTWAARKSRKTPGRGPVGKTLAIGANDRATGQVVAFVIDRPNRDVPQGFVNYVSDDESTV